MIGKMPEKQPVIAEVHSPNVIKRALYYHELLKSGQVQSQRELAKRAGISQTQINHILKLLTLAYLSLISEGKFEI